MSTIDVTVKVLEPADSLALMTLAEAKIALGIPSGDISGDAQIEWFIDENSAVVAALCNRVFAREKVRETWRWEMFGQEPTLAGKRRVWLSRWPVKEDDIESVESPEGWQLDPGMYSLEEETGKLLNLVSGWEDPTVVTYTGGFNLPDEAPLPLKQATGLLVRNLQTQAKTAAITGIKMISHRDSRVMYFDPNTQQQMTGGAGGSAMQRSIDALLQRYMRIYI